MISPSAANQLVEAVRESRLSGAELRLETMERLSRLPGYDWCGIYRLEGDALLLDEFVGAPTDHTRIPVGQGVCGVAVAEDRNQIVSDVRELTNYLSCSLETRSELVVLIRRGDEVLGQIDIDGHRVGSFDSTDAEFLEKVGGLLAERWQ